jgi:pyridoxal phosphate enzyme (YggS family)
MHINQTKYFEVVKEMQAAGATLVAVSKIKPEAAIMELYELGHRDFGENYVQELVAKYEALPKDIRWHFIGHLQSNKVKYIAPFVHLIHGIDSYRLLKEVDKQAGKAARIIDVLLQVHIAQEETKFGFNEQELHELLSTNDEHGAHELHELKSIRIVGLMGMASFSDNEDLVKNELKKLKNLYNKYALLPTANCQLQTLSMGMSADYKIALEEGSNMIRIGSLLFGKR